MNRRGFLGGCALGATLLALGGTEGLGAEAAERGKALDALFTRTSPALARRGFMLDISRCRVPTMDTLRLLVDLLAALRFNELQLYMEHTFAYRGHEVVWREASPMLPEEIRVLDGWCREAGIELVPNQNSLGHMERWLKHPEYLHLAESPKGAMSPWGFRPTPSTMKPGPETEALLKDLYAQLLPCFSSRRFNVGCDEPYDLGQGASKARCEKQGRGAVFLDHLEAVRRLAAEHGKSIEFWADVLYEEKNVALGRIPSDATALVWGYEAEHPFAEQGAQVAGHQVAWQACPGDSTWCSLGGRLHTARGNLGNAAAAAVKFGAEGMLHTHWGDGGHWQPWATLLPGLVLAATAAWNGEPCDWGDLRVAVSTLSGEPSGNLAQALEALGRIDEVHGNYAHNRSLLWEILFVKPGAEWVAGRLGGIEKVRWEQLSVELERIASLCTAARPATAEARRLLDEARFSLRMLSSAEARVKAVLGGKTLPDDWTARAAEIEAEHRRLWLLRHRPGGLEESCSKLRGTVGSNS